MIASEKVSTNSMISGGSNNTIYGSYSSIIGCNGVTIYGDHIHIFESVTIKRL